MNPFEIIDKYYTPGSDLYQVLVTHSRSVADKALSIAKVHVELNDQLEFIEEAALLHDIGIFLTDAPRICCRGTEPYIAHGYLGGQLLRREGYPMHARVCERHTGTGLSVDDIIKEHLPLPLHDFRPERLVEQLICFSDKFYSKTKLDQELSIDHIRNTMAKFGPAHLQQFNEWLSLFM